MKNKFYTLLLFVLFSLTGVSQNNTFSPYSRYGFGELNTTTFAHNMGMGGAYIALKPDSTMPIFINAGNPAAYSLIKLTSLEVGGNYVYSQFSGNNTSLKKWGTNFTYASLGFPVFRNGGACFGIQPYSSVGYDTQSTSDLTGVGTVTNQYSGTGGLNKVFLGYGIMPFGKRLNTFRRKNLYVQDSLKTLSRAGYKTGEFFSKLLSDFSVGANANYIFGNIENITDVMYAYPSLYNNTFTDRAVNVHDFTANFGAQTALTIDSVFTRHGKKRALREKVKITFGFFMNLNNALNANYSYIAYNYLTSGSTVTRLDTILFINSRSEKVRLPMEQGFGIGFKKGERINVVADFALSNWQKVQYPNLVNDFKNSYRVALGGNFVPEKYASGNNAFVKRMNYRAGLSYQSGHITVKNATVPTAAASLGLGIPVGMGRLSSMINVSVQYGKTGFGNKELIQENFWRIYFGFTFSDRWFQKFRYD